MGKDLIATASVTIEATKTEVWDALVRPDSIKQYMFGASVETDWKVGSPITWSGEWEGKKYQDKGYVLRFEPHNVLQYSHFSPLGKQADKPENYHTVTIALADRSGKTSVALEQDHNPSAAARDHSQKNWEGMLQRLKKMVESGRT
jgi:uncharacterized protein YndB with AHSA1/START domain